MRRRTVLKSALALGAAGAAGTCGGLAALQPDRRVWPPYAHGRRTTPASARRVVVVGGGLAGMASAVVLAERGYEVVLLERAGTLGGKLAGWPIEVLGETVSMEHGFHGFFRQYYNVRSLLEQVGALGALVEQPSYTVLFADGRQEPFGTSVAPFPVDLLEVLARSPSLSLADVAGDRPGMRALLSYDPVETFARWDGMDAETFVRAGNLEGPFADLILRPFGQASMNGLEQFSAAELIRFFHFYMLGNPEGLGFDVLRDGSDRTVVAPIRAHLEALGVTIRTHADVQRVEFDDGLAIGVRLGRPEEPPVRVPADEIPDSGWMPVGSVFVRRTAAGFEARSSRCTHMGCPVRLEGAGFLCPCHGGRYDADATPVAGPPSRALMGLRAEEREGEVWVWHEGVEGELVPADAVILATEVRGLERLAEASDLQRHAPRLAESAASGGEADPYAVVRFWFDQPVLAERTAFYTVAGFDWTDSIAVYSAFQEPYIQWARRTGGSVVEVHAYAIPLDSRASLSTYRDGMLAELRTAFPELANAQVLHSESMTQSNFTRFGPGDFAKRPTVRTEIGNLMIAGDHVQLPFPAFLMEAAVASGRLAANALCALDGVEEVAIPTVSWTGKMTGLG